MSEITVIIPTLNEAQGIGPTIQEILKCAGDLEIIVVDANSSDETVQIATRLGVKVIRQQGLGKGKAIAHAFQHINEKTTEFLGIIDGDYTYPAGYISRMIEVLKEDADVGMVTGERFNHKFVIHLKSLMTEPYSFGNYALAFAHRMLNGVKMKDPLTGLRVIRYNYLKDFRPKAKGFDFEVELNHYIVKRKKVRILEIPIKYRPRLGEKKLRIKDGFVILRRIVIMALESFSWLLRH